MTARPGSGTFADTTFAQSPTVAAATAGLPPGGQSADLPRTPTFWPYAYAFGLALVLTAVQVNPFSQTDWPLPQAQAFPATLRTWQWNQTPMLGQDKLPTGAQVCDLTPKSPPHLPLYSWEWRQVGMLGQDKLPIGENIYDLTPKPAQRLPLYSWEWRPTDEIGIILPQGEQVYDLTPKAAPRLPYYGWEWRQVGMLGQDVITVGAQTYDLTPKAAPRLPLYTWEWRQVGMLGQDQLPIGENVYDLTPKPAQRLPVYGWEWRPTEEIGIILPQGEQVYDLPVRAAKPIEQTWTWQQVGMLGQDQLPVGDQFYDVRVLQTRGFDWVAPTNIALTSFFQAPFFQTDWPVPQRVIWYRSWELALAPYLPPGNPTVGQQVYDLTPLAPWRNPMLRSWEWPINVALYVTPPVFPHNQFDWPLARAPQQPVLTWIWRQVGMLGQDVITVGQQVYDLTPKAAPRLSLYSWEWRQVGMLGQDRLPIGLQIYDLTPKASPRLPLYSWEWRPTDEIGIILPQGEQVYDLTPKAAPRLALYTWEWRQVDKLGKDVLPKNQYDWPLPRAPFRPDFSSTLNGHTIVQAIPRNQFDWPIPPRVVWYRSTEFNARLPAQTVRLPFNQFDWPLPTPKFRPDFSTLYVPLPFIIPPPPVVVGGQYKCLVPHYIGGTFYEARSILIEGRDIPFGWVPTLGVDPLNTPALLAFYKAGPRPSNPYQWESNYQNYVPSSITSAIPKPITYWVPVSPGLWALTGIGTLLPPRGE